MGCHKSNMSFHRTRSIARKPRIFTLGVGQQDWYLWWHVLHRSSTYLINGQLVISNLLKLYPPHQTQLLTLRLDP